MAIDGESQNGFGRCVDESKTMLLSGDEPEFGDPSIGRALAAVGHEGAVKVHFAVNETVVGEGFSTTRCDHSLDDAEIFFMVPIAEQNRTDISIIGDVLGSVDNHGAKQAARVLTRVMRVIPAGPIQIRFELIGQGFSGRNGALLDRWHPIEPWRRSLKNPVPVEGRPFFGCADLVGHFHLDGVSPVGFDERGGELTVD